MWHSKMRYLSRRGGCLLYLVKCLADTGHTCVCLSVAHQHDKIALIVTFRTRRQAVDKYQHGYPLPHLPTVSVMRPSASHTLLILCLLILFFIDTFFFDTFSFTGRPDCNLDEQWQRLDEAAEVMASAPDDEIVAELLALQSELVQQSAINRARVAGVLALVLRDMPAQAEAAATRRAQEGAIVAYQAVSAGWVGGQVSPGWFMRVGFI